MESKKERFIAIVEGKIGCRQSRRSTNGASTIDNSVLRVLRGSPVQNSLDKDSNLDFVEYPSSLNILKSENTNLTFGAASKILNCCSSLSENQTSSLSQKAIYRERLARTPTFLALHGPELSIRMYFTAAPKARTIASVSSDDPSSTTITSAGVQD